MGDQDKSRQTDDKQSVEDRSKRADAGAAPEQSDQAPQVAPDKKPGGKPGEEEKNEDVDPREKRQDPPVPGQPKKIKVDQ